MYSFLHRIFADKEGGEIFVLFSGWHFFYLALTLAAIIIALLLLRKKSDNAKRTTAKTFVTTAFLLYMADIFLMPFAYGQIDIEKLPFHACTATCVLCFLSYHIGFLEKHRPSIVLLSFMSNLIYLVYPAGVMWYEIHPTSYRVIQTMLFHSIMTAYGLIVMVTEKERFKLKFFYRDLIMLVCMTIWALIGNYAYSGSAENYSHMFNWFFVVRDPFSSLPEDISKFIMPFLNILVFFAAEVVLHLIIDFAKKRSEKKKA